MRKAKQLAKVKAKPAAADDDDDDRKMEMDLERMDVLLFAPTRERERGWDFAGAERASKLVAYAVHRVREVFGGPLFLGTLATDLLDEIGATIGQAREKGLVALKLYELLSRLEDAAGETGLGKKIVDRVEWEELRRSYIESAGANGRPDVH